MSAAVETESRVLTNAATKPPRKQNPPPTVRPLIVKPPVYRKVFKLPPPHEGRGVVELHPDKIVVRRRRRAQSQGDPVCAPVVAVEGRAAIVT